MRKLIVEEWISLDGYYLQLCPVLTGGGRALFPEFSDPQKLKLTEMRKYDTGTIFLNYQPKGKNTV